MNVAICENWREQIKRAYIEQDGKGFLRLCDMTMELPSAPAVTMGAPDENGERWYDYQIDGQHYGRMFRSKQQVVSEAAALIKIAMIMETNQ